MEIIVGRKQETNQLKITIGKQDKVCGAANSIPNNVSRRHFSLTSDQSGGFILKNLNPANETFVNGVSVDQKRVFKGDKIEMGVTRCPFNWQYIEEVVPTTVDLRPLRVVWEEYEKKKMDMEVKERKFNAIKGFTGLITMVAMVLTVVGATKTNENGGMDPRVFLYGAALLAGIIANVITYMRASKTPQERKNVENNFRKNYICPNPKCHHFMGNQPYDILSQNHACPYCKAQYKEK
ncbi:MAG: FHA domain-containing protein [Prevotella sp.]|nr:FHA domain-containing protein [Prevotella sp.]